MSGTGMVVARFIVRGKVQGVWFRAGTRDEATRLGLRGYASNLPNGEVEVLAAGDADAVEGLQRWLQQGPPLARVDAVLRLLPGPVDVLPAAGFDIR